MCGAVMWVLPQRTKEKTKRQHSSGQNVNTEDSQKSKSRNQWVVSGGDFIDISILTRSMFVFSFLIILTWGKIQLWGLCSWKWNYEWNEQNCLFRCDFWLHTLTVTSPKPRRQIRERKTKSWIHRCFFLWFGGLTA